MGRIVVGVDGSDESRTALRWAVDEARRRGAEVDAVCAWSYPAASYFGALMPPPAGARDQLVAEATAILDEACNGLGSTGIPINRIVEEGSPARCLLDTAKSADLLVVGSRGRGGFASLLLGSVSQQCAHHATCPVVIIR